ncbi:thymidine kinase [Roseibium denhamense]|uniref:Thymidine kinase n=1 Tax=Roseibium denhamense TaxID=76305 RepID=A0ABY1NF89_9HYPH|nr:thymidine kinase [Roseibium denhamense]MTI04148.1 thymidine kinase [Roseibium denhamense]SMP07935.1 thymidine kinase [Roseibium denhamense]
MAKLYFNYSSMNAGKSTVLLQAAYNYQERGMTTLLLIAAFDDRAGTGRIASRIGLAADADVFSSDTDVLAHVTKAHRAEPVNAVLVDEAQFLTEAQVWQLARVADELRIPVMCFGLRTDFQGKLFPGSAALLAIADNLKEIKTVCWCGRKATMVARLDGEGKIVEEGNQVVIGGNETYVSLCRRHWSARQLSDGSQDG